MTLTHIVPIIFIALWALQSWLIERSPWATKTLTAMMGKQRRLWIETMAKRDLRMIDTSIIAGLQSGTAFFASTSLLAIGGAFFAAQFSRPDPRSDRRDPLFIADVEPLIRSQIDRADGHFCLCLPQIWLGLSVI